MVKPRETLAISIVSATWNERETLPALVQRIHEALSRIRHEIIIVDDSSPDGTYTLASKLADKAICKKREGQSIALLTGIREAKHPIVVTIDADLENDPSNIPALVSKIEEGYDLVVASRRTLPRISERLFSRTIGRWIGVSDVLSNFRAMRKDEVIGIAVGRRETFGAEFLIRAYKQGLRVTQVQVENTPRRRDPRIGGTLKANLRILKAMFICLLMWLS